MNKMNASLAILLVSCTMFAMDSNNNNKKAIQFLHQASTFKGEAITPETIKKLAPVPEDLQEAVDTQLQKIQPLLHELAIPYNELPLTRDATIKKLVTCLAIQKKYGFNPATIKIKIDPNGADIAENKIEIPESANFYLPIKVEGKTILVRIAGPSNTRKNLAAHNGLGWDAYLDNSKHDVVQTYQTVSNARGFLKLHEALGHTSTGEYFQIPNTYIVNIPGRNNDSAADGNVITLQEDFDRSYYLKAADNLEYLADIFPASIERLYQLITKSGATLWDIKGNLLINSYTGAFAQTDLEQPNDQKPEIFGYNVPEKLYVLNQGFKNPLEYADYKLRHDILCGVEGIGALLKDAETKGYNTQAASKTLYECLAKDEILAHGLSDHSAGVYKRILDGILK